MGRNIIGVSLFQALATNFGPPAGWLGDAGNPALLVGYQIKHSLHHYRNIV